MYQFTGQCKEGLDSDDGQVILSGKALEDGYEISVEDNGQGIPASELSKISDAFYMVDKAQARGLGPGAGLGLAPVQRNCGNPSL